MYIVYENENNLEQLRSKYLVLELDTVEIKKDQYVSAFAVITAESVLLQEIATLTNRKELHENLIKNYKLQNWQYCEEAITNLVGSFKGELDSFYEILSIRIGQLKNTILKENWNGTLSVSGAFV